MRPFQIFSPVSLKEALMLLDESETKRGIIAGGTDVMVQLRKQGVDPYEFSGLIDISRLVELKFVQVIGDLVSIGAMVTFSELIDSEVIKREVPILSDMAQRMGSPQIRNRATVGGNIVNASSAADGIPPLLAVDADVVLKSAKGTRTVSIENFIRGAGQTVIRPNEILTEIMFHRLPAGTEWSYIKLGRRKSAAISRESVSVIKLPDRGDTAHLYRIAIGAVTPRPIRLRKAEMYLTSNGSEPDRVAFAAKIAREEAESIAGKRWSSAYKLPVLENLIIQALEELRR